MKSRELLIYICGQHKMIGIDHSIDWLSLQDVDYGN